MFIIRPRHPIQRTLDSTEIALTGVKVRSEEDLRTSRFLHLSNINAVAGKRGNEDFIIDHKLRGTTGVLFDFLTDGAGLVDVPPVEVEGDEDIHVVVCGGFVGEV